MQCSKLADERTAHSEKEMALPLSLRVMEIADIQSTTWQSPALQETWYHLKQMGAVFILPTLASPHSVEDDLHSG